MANIDVIKKIPLFRECSNAELIKIANIMSKVSFNAGDVVFKKGDAGNAFFLIREGEVEVLASPGDKKVEEVVTLIGPGDLFGEMALVEKEPRSATVRVKTDAKLWRIKKEYFEDLMKQDHELALKIYRRLTIIISHRLRETTERLAIANQIIRMTSER